jgi:hypothetical protein
MGLFDYIHCKYPLPSCPQALIDRWGKTVGDIAFQTKDTPDQGMTPYVITADGYLLANRKEYEWIDTPEKVDKTAAPLQAWFDRGYNKVTREWQEQCHHFNGSISFYDSYPHADKTIVDDYQQGEFAEGWVEYEALFQNGQIIQIHQREHTLPLKYSEQEIEDRRLSREAAVIENRKRQHAYRHEHPTPEQRVIDSIESLIPAEWDGAFAQIQDVINKYREKYDRWYKQP